MFGRSNILWAGMILFAVCQPSRAEYPSTTWEAMVRDSGRNIHWPRPFVYQDRAAVCAPFQVMVVNGWRRQNLVGEHHFLPGTSELTAAGRLKAMWILTQAPPQHRTIFVQRGNDRDETRERIDAVQQLAVHLLPTGELPDVQETHIVPEGRPAGPIDHVFQKFQETGPPPQLPASTSGGSGFES